jgi:uncharacterized protein (TIGR03435 family)
MPRFRSAAIAPGFDTGPASGLLVNPQGAFNTNNLPLRRLIGFAYDLQDPEIVGPESLDSERYSIAAQAEQVPALPEEIDQFRLMVRELLAERFGLDFHWEIQRSNALALLRGADTPGLRRAVASDPGPVLRLRAASSISVGNAALEPLFTSWLSTRFGTPVIDRTGLSGGYNFDLKWESKEPGDDALKEVLQTQLGLTLEAIETDIERMVVDRLDRPTDLEPIPIEVDIDLAILDRYVGHYALPGASIMSISRDGAKLLSRLTGQGPVEIFPASETDFFAKAIPARVRFVVDGKGRALALALRQSGREIHAPRVDDAAAERWIAAREKRD